MMQLPQTPEGQLWFQEFQERLQRFIQSNYREKEHLREGGRALQFLFERCPESAAFVQHQAVSVASIVLWNLGHGFADRIFLVGYEVGTLLTNRNRKQILSAAFLASELAASMAQKGNLYGAARFVRAADAELEPLPNDNLAVGYLRARNQFIAGQIYRSVLEYRKATEAYESAITLSHDLFDNEQNHAALIDACSELFWVEQEPMPSVVKQRLLTGVGGELNSIRLQADILLAGLRAQPRYTRERAERAWQSIVKAGSIPAGISMWNLFDMLGHCDSTTIVERAHTLLSAFKNNREELTEATALFAGQSAVVMAREQNKEQLEDTLRAARTTAAESSSKVRAVTLGCLSIAEPDASDNFANFVSALADLDPDALRDPRSRVRMEESAQSAVHWAFGRYKQEPSQQTRITLGLLLEGFRSTIPFAPPSPDAAGQSIINNGLMHSIDWLGRAQFALKRHPAAVVIVLQQMVEQTLFVCVSSEAVNAATSNKFNRASRSLAKSARRAARYAGAEDIEEQLLQDAVAAHMSLPETIRSVIERKDTVLICPDYRSDHDAVPFELFHDGQAYLGQKKVVARFPSLRILLRSLEGETNISQRRRALILAATEETGLEPLPYAEPEAGDLNEKLRGQGYWDIPECSQDELSASYIVNRLPFVSVLHLSAHGEALAGQEELLLSQGRKFVTADLLSAPPVTLPFVYLNTCSLAETRYLGGGVSRGMAHTFLELGAPAVIANLSRIEDQAASAVASNFYDEAASCCVGEALRAARQAIPEPANWGSTVLMGNPWLMLPGSNADPVNEASVVPKLLEGFSTTQAPSKEDSALFHNLITEHQPDDYRLVAALSFVQVCEQLITDAPDAPDPHLVVNLADALGNDAAYAFALHLAYEADSAAGTLTDPHGRVDAVLKALRGRTNAIAVEYLLRKRRLREGQLGMGYKITSFGDQKDEKAQEAAEVLMETQQLMAQSAEEAWGPVTMRYPENGTYDAVWNAIVRGYPDRIDGMHETASIAQLLAARLEQDGRLPSGSSPEADTALAGLLRYLWKQNRESGPLNYELVEGYVQTLLEGIDDINALLTSPATPWRERFRQFSRDIEEQVTRLETNLGDWEKTSKEVSALIIETSLDFAETIRADMPEAIRFASAYILGTIIRVNQFSPNLSKAYYNCLVDTYESVASRTAYRDLYLNAGFEKMRTSRDALAGWRAHGV